MQNSNEAEVTSPAARSPVVVEAAQGLVGEPTETGWRLIRKWIVAGNPFYPLSAVLVLFGIFLMSGEERMFGAELTQLWFNFSALEIYGLLIVLTAVYLVQLKIHYDTLMLVVLATLPILVPFILISQAAFLGGGLMALFCGVAALAGWTQYAVLRRGISDLPLRGGLGGYFLLIVALNLALPVAIKQFHTSADAIRWAVQLERYGHFAWNLVLPALVLGGFGVRVAQGARFGRFGVGWLPLTWMMLLVAGTAAHVASLGYVYSFPWKLAYAYPVVWLSAWLCWWRRREWAPEDSALWRERLVVLPAFVALLAWLDSQASALCWLNALNLACFGWLLWRRPKQRHIAVLLAASLVGCLRTFPLEFLMDLPQGRTRLDLILLIVSFGTLAIGSWRRAPIWGVLAALAVIHPLQFFWVTASSDWPLVGQLALLTWWLHSLRWDLSAAPAIRLRRLAFGFWVLHSLLWFLQSGGEGRIPLIALAMVVGGTASLSAWLRARTGDWGYAGLAALVGLLNHLPGMIEQVRRVPSGLMILAGGMVCFGLGTAVALWRKRWEGQSAPPRD